LKKIFLALRKQFDWKSELEFLHSLSIDETFGKGFQIHAMEALGVSWYLFLRHWDWPKNAILSAIRIGVGGDTIACLVGSLCGDLHGRQAWPGDWVCKLDNNHDFDREDTTNLAKMMATKAIDRRLK
jgi:ADP-ribosylglycohydrolase